MIIPEPTAEDMAHDLESDYRYLSGLFPQSGWHALSLIRRAVAAENLIRELAWHDETGDGDISTCNGCGHDQNRPHHALCKVAKYLEGR